MRKISKILISIALVLGIVLGSVFANGTQEAEAKNEKVKVGFIYIGPAGDFGWTYPHEQGRQYVMEKFPEVESITVESVPEGDAVRFIDRLVQEEKCNVIITTSFGYMDDTVVAADRYKDVIFMHCSGFKVLDNLGTYMGDLYEMYYLNGMMAGALTKTNKIGYVAAFPIPELFRHIDAFAMGVEAVNPDARVHIKWTYAWYGPDKAKEAAEALVAEGCDALAFTEDTPAVCEVGQSHTERGKQIYTFSHYSPMQVYGEDSIVSGQLIDWGIMYEYIIQNILDGTWTNERLWWEASEGAAKLGASVDELINPKFVQPLKDAGVYEKILSLYEQMKTNEFDPYTGPLYDQKGNLVLKDGQVASVDFLENIMFYVPNIVGTIPNE